MLNRKILSGLLSAAALAAALTLAGCGDKKPAGSPDITPSDQQPVAATDPVQAANAAKSEFIFTASEENVDKDQIFTCFEIVRNRLFCEDVKGNVSINEDGTSLKVSLPEKETTDELLAFLTRKGDFTIRRSDETDTDGSPTGEILINNSDIDTASLVILSGTESSYGIGINMNGTGAEKFAKATEELAGTDTALSVWLDSELLYSPKVTAKISDGNMMITGDFDMDEAGRLVGLINSGALPVAMKADKS